jgi:hypothetical protein
MINKKHLLIGCSVVLFVAVALLSVGAYFVYRAFRRSLAEMSKAPPELSQTGVLVGEGLLSKDIFANDRRLSKIQAMTFGQVDPGDPDELCSVSGFGAMFLDSSGAVKRYIPYGMQQVKVLGTKIQAAGARISRFQIIDLGGAGECSFLARGGAMGSELIGHDGKSVWLLGGIDPRTHPSDMIAGDLNGDGKIEFVGIYELGNKGVVLYDASLNELWSKPEMRASHVELVDAQGGRKSIACCVDHGINILNTQGDLVKNLEIPLYLQDFLILSWPPASDTQYILCHDNDSVDLYDLGGRLMFKCDMPGSSHLDHFVAEAFTVGKVSYLAITGSLFWSGNRSVFCVYALPDQPLRNQVVRQSPLYREVLDQTCESMTKLPADDSGRVSILIGGVGQILRYTPLSLPSVPPKPLTPAHR